jgi:hypothetical protein
MSGFILNVAAGAVAFSVVVEGTDKKAMSKSQQLSEFDSLPLWYLGGFFVFGEDQPARKVTT